MSHSESSSQDIPEQEPNTVAHEYAPKQAHPQSAHSEIYHPSPLFQALLSEIESFEEVERKLERAIHFMELAISQSGSPHFKDFWDAKKLCIDLFKSNINPSVRVHLWTRYSELCLEARKLKEIFDEQSAFAVEQIEMALSAIEADIGNIETFLDKSTPVDFLADCRFLADRVDDYAILQRELNLLNVFATKTTALRKELVKTEMRIRNKNRFFQRLSQVGDKIFPRRKELIHQISELFKQDIDRFIQVSFSQEAKTQELFDLREEIKAFQNIAKLLTLNTEAFSHTRQRLSECWDSIKLLVQERKKAAGEQRALFKQHKDAFLEEIEALKKGFHDGTVTAKAVDEKIDDISSRMRKTQLGKIEIRVLRDEIRALRDEAYEKVRSTQDQEKNVVRERQVKNKSKLEEIKKALEGLVAKLESETAEELMKEVAALVRQLAQLAIPEAEKLHVEKEIHQFRDRVQQKRAQSILSLSQDDQVKLTALQGMLQEEQLARQALKARLEAHRKTKGSSSLDFGAALQYNDTIQEEKERLDMIDNTIQDLERQIAELEGV